MNTGTQLVIPSNHTLEVKEQHDKVIRLRNKAHHKQTYILWSMIYDILPEVRIGTWSIRHSMTKVFLVKISDHDGDH